MSDSSPCRTYFLSYSRSDQDFALRFAQDLRANGVAIWVDQLDIRPSEHWDRAIERMVRDCCGLLVILSPRSVASDNVADEISYAIDHRKSVLPVMIERCSLPLRITRMQVIDATGDYSRALQLCIEVITGTAAEGHSKKAATVQAGVDDKDALDLAKRELTAILGPIASVLVDKEALHARSIADLRARLSEHIPEKHDRERFAGPASKTAHAKGEAPPAVISPVARSDVDRLASTLTHYLGPVAHVIARRESASATSKDDLEQRLALRIADEREREDFLERLRSS